MGLKSILNPIKSTVKGVTSTTSDTLTKVKTNVELRRDIKAGKDAMKVQVGALGHKLRQTEAQQTEAEANAKAITKAEEKAAEAIAKAEKAVQYANERAAKALADAEALKNPPVVSESETPAAPQIIPS